jgi:hypothetical protein
LTEIKVQFVESKSDTDSPYEVQVKVGLGISKIELEKKTSRQIYISNKFP